MILSRATKLFRFCNYTPEIGKKQLEERIRNDRFRVFKKYQPNLSNRRFVMQNFKQFKNDPVYLDRCEIQTRIMKRIYDSELIDLKLFSFDKDLRSDLKFDSLNMVVLLTEIQHQFTTVFEDKVFQSVRRLDQIVDILVRDEKIF